MARKQKASGCVSEILDGEGGVPLARNVQIHGVSFVVDHCGRWENSLPQKVRACLVFVVECCPRRIRPPGEQELQYQSRACTTRKSRRSAIGCFLVDLYRRFRTEPAGSKRKISTVATVVLRQRVRRAYENPQWLVASLKGDSGKAVAATYMRGNGEVLCRKLREVFVWIRRWSAR